MGNHQSASGNGVPLSHGHAAHPIGHHLGSPGNVSFSSGGTSDNETDDEVTRSRGIPADKEADRVYTFLKSRTQKNEQWPLEARVEKIDKYVGLNSDRFWTLRMALALRDKRAKYRTRTASDGALAAYAKSRKLRFP